MLVLLQLAESRVRRLCGEDMDNLGKSGEFYCDANVIVHEIMSCEHKFTAGKVIFIAYGSTSPRAPHDLPNAFI